MSAGPSGRPPGHVALDTMRLAECRGFDGLSSPKDDDARTAGTAAAKLVDEHESPPSLPRIPQCGSTGHRGSCAASGLAQS